ncbi:MAG TPA: response regulator, partial [Gammaproteobacteria bacterium]|nr:response regulator [Gammaproteobacteria bacterium]
EDDCSTQESIKTLIGNNDVHITSVQTGAEAEQEICEKDFDCVVLDLGLSDMTGFELLDKLQNNKNLIIPPVIVYTGKELSQREVGKLREYSQSIIIKGAKSEERLLDETALFLHRVIGNLPRKKQKMITDLRDQDAIFQNKTILVVDDDMRNVFALSQFLSEKGFHVIRAEDGEKGLQKLSDNADISIVLMDIMMPRMDGYEAIKQIRAQEQYKKLPIIALTAKAMREDRENCIAAGANDYLSKPVDVTRLLSMLRVWLYSS